MRIAQIHKFFRPGGGADRYMAEVARLLQRDGHGVGIFSTAGPDNLAHDGPARFVEGRQIERMRVPLWRAAPLALSCLYSRRVERELDAFLQDFRPDAAHLHNYHYHLTPSILRALRRRRIPVVHTLHDYHLVCPNHNLFDTRRGRPCEACARHRFLGPLLLRCREGSWSKSALASAELALYRDSRLYREAVHTYLSPSRFLLEKLRAMGFDPPRASVLPNFVDLAVFRPADSPADRADPPALIHFAGLAPHKGIATAIRAMARIPRARLWIAGAGAMEAPARRMAAECAPGRIEFLGYRSSEELREIVPRAALSIQCPDWPENGPLSLLESLACGVPVVAARTGGLPEAVAEGETGALFPPGDAEALAAAVNGLLADSARLAQMGRAARSDAERRFGAAGHMRRLMDYYAEAAERAAR
ncbi:MAG: D-inositol 3-phosphate glycosyltransferase [candidate division BRC1 bacterium ADurb.BinA364]|nr:MAG: D-inositol 3-phosphate glycosyltransferase [candidate division BRC1 bacterium ADurb.BinA364]